MDIYKRLLVYVRPHLSLFLVSIMGFLLYSGTQTLFAAMLKHIVDTLQTESREGMYYLPLLFCGLMFFHGIGAFLGNYYLARVATNVVHTLRCEIFYKYTRLPVSFFDANNSGYLISKITNNVGEVTKATTDAIRTFIREGFTTIGLLIYLFYSNWQLSLIFIAVAPIIVIIVTYVSKRLRMLSRRIQDSIGDMTHITSELVTGSRVVRSYGGEEYEWRRFLESSRYNRRQSLKLATTMSIHNPLMQLIIGIVLSVLMYMALFFMKQASVGEFVGYLTAAFLLPKPIRQLSDANGDIQKGIAAAESLFDILDEPEEQDSGSYEVERSLGALEFKNLFFRYPNAKDFALQNINLKIEPGQTVALVGSSGGGKSTLASLVLRFYQHDQGQILLDGVEISDYRLANLRQQIALVNQQVTLFNDTIANNIAYGRLAGASHEQISAAATDAYAMQFITQFDKGLETEIGENGVKLSGGQRQRLALARALLKDAPILILDEATSALDNESERYIQAALQTIIGHRTTLVIAHRLSTIEMADVIVVIEKGYIVEQGTHTSLLDKNGMYARLYNLQFKEKVEKNDAIE